MIYRTTSERRHYHAFLLDEDVIRRMFVQNSPEEPPFIPEELVGTDIGVTSTDNKHSHRLVVDEGGNVLLTPGPDGHTHDVIAYDFEDPAQKKEDEKEKIERVLELTKDARSREENGRKWGEEAWGIYDGTRHWKAGAKEKLAAQHRAALTINEVAPKIDLMSGFQRQNKADIRVEPKESGDERVAEILTFLIKNVEDRNNSNMHESSMFLDQIVAGRGIDMVSMDWDKSVEGEIRHEHTKWDALYLGPHERFDIEDLEYYVAEHRMSRAKVKETWPEKEDEIEAWIELITKDGVHSKDIHASPLGVPLMDLARKEIFVYELVRKVFRPVYSADFEGIRYDLAGVKKKDVNKLDTIEGVVTRRRVVHDIYTTMIGGQSLLEDYKNDIRELPISVAYCKLTHEGDFYSKVHEVRDNQHQINKSESNLSDWINRGAGGTKYYVRQDGFASNEELNKFKKTAAQPFGVFTVQGEKPEREDVPTIPTALLTYREVQSQNLQRTMNIPLEAFGVNLSSEVSGRAILESRRSGMAANEYLFDHMSLARARRAKLIIAYISEYYTSERIYREIHTSKPDQLRAEIQQMDQIEIQRIFSDREALLNYDIKMSESPESETYKAMVFMEFLDLVKSGALPYSGAVFDLLVQNSMMTEEDKKRVMSQMQQESAQNAASQRNVDQREMLKSLSPELQTAIVSQSPELQRVLLGEPGQQGPEGNVQQNQPGSQQ